MQNLGVERNAASRFVDHTLATPWEQLALNIECAAKKLLKMKDRSPPPETIDYLGKKYELSIHSNAMSRRSASVHMRFGVDQFLLFRRSSTEWLDDTPSRRRTMFSAAVTALHSCLSSCEKDGVVSLFLPLSVDLEESNEILGYRIIPYEGESVIVNYEALSLPRVHDHHEMRYVDGLAKLFIKKLALHEDEFHFNGSNCFARVTEEFAFSDFDRIISHQRGQGNSLPNELPRFPARRFIPADIGIPARSSEAAITVVDSNEAALHAHEILESLWMPFCGPRQQSRLQHPILLTELICNLKYPFIKCDSIADSVHSTTLVPSRQRPNCWSLHTSFAVTGRLLMDSSGTSTHAKSFFPLSRSIRRLIAFLVYGKSCPRGMTMGALSSDAGNANYERSKLFVEDKARTISSVLSKQTRSAVSELYNGGKASMRLRDIIDNTHETLLQLLFDNFDESIDASTSRRSASRVGPGDSLSSSVTPPPLERDKHKLDGGNSGNVTAGKHCGDDDGDGDDGYESANDGGDDNATTGTAAAAAAAVASTENPSSHSSSSSSSSRSGKPSVASASRASSAQHLVPALSLLPLPLSLSSPPPLLSPSLENEWLSLCSMYISSLDGGITAMADFWVACLSSFRESWELGSSIPHLRKSSGWQIDDAKKGGRRGRGAQQQSTSDLPSSSSPSPSSSSPSAVVAVVAAASSAAIPLWQRHLWDDIQTRRAAAGHPFDIPDCSVSLLAQKLQMLQMCIHVKDEDTTCSYPPCTIFEQGAEEQSDIAYDGSSSTGGEGSVSVSTTVSGPLKPVSVRLHRRVPVTDDALAQQEYIARRLVPHMKLPASDQLEPRITGDTLSAEQKLLQWQVKYPAVVSDMKVWKAANNKGIYADFTDWYFLGVDSITRGQMASKWEELFSSCPAVHAADQKPLFRAEAEAEKSLDFLNSLSPAEVSSELLASAMYTSYYMLWHCVEFWLQSESQQGVAASPDAGAVAADAANGTNDEVVGEEDDPLIRSVREKLNSEFTLLRNHIEEVAALVRHDAARASANALAAGNAAAADSDHNSSQQLQSDSDIGMSNNSSSSGSSSSSSSNNSSSNDHKNHVLVLADQVADLFETIEEFCERAMELDDMLFTHCGITCSPSCRRRFIVSLTSHGAITAESEEEKRVMFEIARMITRIDKGTPAANTGGTTGASTSHQDSFSGDDEEVGGRELGTPTERTVDIRYKQQQSGYIDDDMNDSARPPSLHKVTPVFSDDAHPPPHRLFASITGSNLRASFTLCDCEQY